MPFLKFLFVFCIFFVACNAQQISENEKNKNATPDSSKAKSSNHPTKKNQKDTLKTPIDSLKKSKIKTVQLANQKKHLENIISKMQKGDSVKIICYGNSITNGYKVGSYSRVDNPYPETLEKLLQNHFKNTTIDIINEGHNGWRSDQALNHLATLVLPKNPDLVILKLGINDAYNNFSLSLYESKINAIVQALKKNNVAVLLLTPTPINTPFQEKVLTYCPVLKKIAEQQDCAFFNLNLSIIQRLEKEQIPIEDLLPDDVHFADDKYVWIAEAVFEFLK